MDPLAAHTVQLVLQYISPLSDPIPPHLVSTPLRQRHHFLQISPSSPVEYLCWPSPDNVKIIHLLDHLSPLSDHTNFPTRYTSDSESTFAHVQISSDAQGLRMLFHWDDSHGWKYHDLRLMPFPYSSYSTPRESLATTPESGNHSVALASLQADHFNSGDNDSYWDAYEAAEHDLVSPPPSNTDAVEGEDAYWAQYASVQGSADSTIPSPLPAHRKLRPANPAVDGFPSQNDPIVDIPADAIHARCLASRLKPPSPDTLAHLLSTISPRKDISSIRDYPDSLRSPSACSDEPSPDQTAAGSALVTPPMPTGHFDTSISPVAFKLDGVPLSDCPLRAQAEDAALTNSIKGLYYLWKVGRKGEPEEKDRGVFLQIVQAAITHE